ncbi:uncharacterized protein LOC115462781 [Microcaecilia unicolor]|uniref:Uncharacterized protein LOC115462781 n=1 Tax=Microcaecilia unicolor TaxID=1415580 RepID=A0A6P7WZD5_9AMPH|nr:uncharacterized protein LOC115462781 [Microcaecilia unicolor]XP_030048637.1 uncharacterized protein LOC115462781 [Microcaecilia unicolor]
MGNYMRIRNETPYTFSYSYCYHVAPNTIQGGGILEPGRTIENPQEALPTTVYVKYGRHSYSDSRYKSDMNEWYNGINKPTFFIRVIGADRSRLQLGSDRGGEFKTCPNYGKLEEEQERQKQEQRQREAEEARRQQEEARRMQEQLEKELRIQEDLERETKALEKNLCRLSEQMKYRQRGREMFHQREEMLQYFPEDTAADIETYEGQEAEDKFRDLLNENQIQEDPSMSSCDIRERMKTLQYQLILQYFTEKNFSIWSFNSLNITLANLNPSLREALSLLQAVIHLGHEELDIVKLLPPSTEIDDKSSCIIHLIHVLYKTNKTLAWKLSRTIFSELSNTSQEYLGQILFNGIWTPTQAVTFSLQASQAIDSQENVERILQKAQTYKINANSTITALTENDPLNYLQLSVNKEKDKDSQSILDEMRANKYPEKILAVLEPVLQRMEMKIPQYWSNIKQMELSDEMKREGIALTRSLDLTNPDQETLIQILHGLSIAVQDATTTVKDSGEVKEGYFPRQTQLASLVTLLLSKTPEISGCLLEIATGEGKSAIVAMLALIQAIRGRKVDVITSNPVLARRDKEDWEKLYKMFGVSCNVIPPPGLEEITDSQQREKAVKQAYKADILYGTVSNFAADILRQEFEKKTTRGDRPFDVAIVDEVDYMTLDSGVQVTYLSHAATGMRHLEPLLAAIWAKVCTCQQIEDAQTGERFWTTGAQYFHKTAATAVMGSETSEHFNPQDILMPGLPLGFFTEEDIQKLASKVNESTGEESKADDSEIKEIMNKLDPPQQQDLLTLFQKVLEDSVLFVCCKVQNGKAVSCDANSTVAHDNKIQMLLLEHGLACTMVSEEDLITATVNEIESRLRFTDVYTPPNEKTDENFLIVPGYLKEYTNNRLPVFVENALKAILMETYREYMIESAIDPGKDTTVSESQDYDEIIPVDFRATGILEKNKRWGDGLQQFLQMKHQLAISPLTNVTNFMSNFHFFKRYIKGTGMFGMSGTLGDEAEIDFLKKHFNTSCFPIPTHRHIKRVELPALQVEGGNDTWIKEICNHVRDRASEKDRLKGQAALVVCEDVRTADELQKKLLEHQAVPSSDKITMYTRSDRHNVEGKTFKPGDVIIATNLGGRGTDFKINNDVNESGGLCVILTHFPKNMRVEKQIFGRTSRKGNPGMVQMILNYENLAPSYQDQPVEIMRQLRTDYEKRRIADMEDDELLEATMREDLFNFFCNLLNEFDGNYSKREKLDMFTCSDMALLRNVFGCFKSKMDFKPALNALKETWALWLTLHEKDINDHANVDQLRNDLSQVVKMKIKEVLEGNSQNFYDFTKLALDRMYLHSADKDNDYGALEYWKKAESTDQVYCAMSLYNRAYITVNLGRNGYIQKAIDLLNDTKKAIDIYVSEQTNTTVAGQLSCIAQFEPHYKEEPNFTKQMQCRMSLVKSWIDYIDKSTEKLSALQKENEDAITKDVAVFTLSDGQDYITTEELNSLYDMGLSFVFEVEKKPRFCIDALICAILGALQILAGILVCALSFGTATQFGMGLISEGVSDMISGIVGMVTGSFSWAEWAISKAISISMSVMTAGFSIIKKAVTTVYKVTKSLVTGAKSFASVADDIIKSGKAIFTSVKGTVTSAVSSISKESLQQSIKTLATSSAARNNFIQAAKFAGQEIVKEGVMTALETGVEEALQATFQAMFENSLKETISSAMRENTTMNKYLTKFIVIHSVPESVLKSGKTFTIISSQKRNMKFMVQSVCRSAVNDVTNDFATFNTVMSHLQTVKSVALTVMKEAKVKGSILKGVKFISEFGKYTTDFLKMLNAIPTKAIIDNRVVPFIVKQIDASPSAAEFKEDARCDTPDVQTLRDDLLSTACQELAKNFVELLSSRLTRIVSKVAKKNFGEHVTNTVENIVGSKKTKQFFDDQSHGQEMKKIQLGRGNQTLTEPQQKKFDEYVKKLQDEKHPATELHLNILTKSDLLQGKGIQIQMVDENGKKLSTETYPGKDSSAGTITLQLTKEREQTGSQQSLIEKVQTRIRGEETAYSGNFSLVNSDGTLIPIKSKDPASIYSSLAVARGAKTEEDIQTQANELKSKVNEEISQNTDHYQKLIKHQMDYEEAYSTPGKYTIHGSAMTTQTSQTQSSGVQAGSSP